MFICFEVLIQVKLTFMNSSFKERVNGNMFDKQWLWYEKEEKKKLWITGGGRGFFSHPYFHKQQNELWTLQIFWEKAVKLYYTKITPYFSILQYFLGSVHNYRTVDLSVQSFHLFQPSYNWHNQVWTVLFEVIASFHAAFEDNTLRGSS